MIIRFYLLTLIISISFSNVAYSFFSNESSNVTNINVIFNFSTQNVECNGDTDGIASVTNIQGVPPFTFLWSNGETTQTISNLPAHIFYVTVTDANGNSDSQGCVIYQPSVILTNSSITLSSYPLANDGEIDLTVTGGSFGAWGYSYLWSNGATTQDISNLFSGIYSVTVTDANGCTAFASFIVNDLSFNPLVLTDSITNISCNGLNDGSISISISGGALPYSYLWSNGDTTANIDGLDAGNYSVEVFESGLAQAVNSWPWSYINSGANHTILIQPGTVQFNNAPLPVGSYIGVFYYDNGILECGGYTEWIDSVAAITAWGDEPSTTMNTEGFADGESFIFQVNVLGVSYFMDATFNSTFPNQGNYLTNGMSAISSLHESTGSSISSTFSISEPDSIQVLSVITNIDPLSNPFGSIDITAIGGTSPYTYMWSNGETTSQISNLIAGSYSLTIIDSNQCEFTDTYIVTQTVGSLVIDVFSENILCNGDNNGSAWVIVNNGVPPFTYLWSNVELTQQINNLLPGIYYVTVIDSNSDIGVGMVEVTEPDSISVSASIISIDPSVSLFGSVDISVIGGIPPYSYNWSNGEITEDLLSITSGQYVVTITDANACSLIETFFVDYVLLPNWNFIYSGNSHSIDIPATTLIEINGSPIANGDFIGVFYDSLGNQACAGYTIWMGNAETILVYGDDLLTPEPDGFTVAEEFNWIIWDASADTEYLAAASYDITYSYQQFWQINGESGIDSLQCVTITGTISTTTKSNLPVGMVVLYEPNQSSYYAIARGLVTNGQYKIEGVLPGQYLVYAIPVPGYDYGIPGYFVQRDNWDDAALINANGYTDGIDITIDPVLPYNSGIGAISGNIYVGSDDSYNPNVFGDEWFAGTVKDDETPARNIPILLYDDNMNVLDFRLSNEFGSFEFEQLELGSYFIRVEKAGLQADEIEIVLTTEDPVSDGMAFSLESGIVNSIPESFENDGVSLYPNPFKNELTVEGLESEDRIAFYDILGKAQTFDIISNQPYTISLKNKNNGIYFISIERDNEVRIVKIIKQ